MTDAGYVQVQDSPSLSSPKGSHLHSANNAALRPAAVRREERWCGGVVLFWWYLLWGEPETGCCLVDWAGRGLVTVSITPPLHPLPLLSCSPPPVLLLSPGHWSPGASLPWIQLQQMQTFLCLPASISSLDSWDNANASKCECECALESFDRKDGTSTFPIIWKLFRILNFDIIFNSSGIKQVGHIEFDKICKIASIPYYI